MDRLRGMGLGQGWETPAALSTDPMNPPPSSIRDYIHPNVQGVDATNLARIDGAFLEACRRAIVVTTMALKRRRDPNSRHWQEGLPVFLAGGGSRIPLYRSALDMASRTMIAATGVAGFRVQALPKPPNLANRDIRDADFQLLSVAFGLSHERIVIGDIQPPSEIYDVERPKRKDWESGFVDKDHM